MPPGRGAPRAGFPVRCPFPLQCEINNAQTINGRRGQRFAGGIYAAPTHRPNAVASQKTLLWGGLRGGGRERPPYKPGQTTGKPGTSA